MRINTLSLADVPNPIGAYGGTDLIVGPDFTSVNPMGGGDAQMMPGPPLSATVTSSPLDVLNSMPIVDPSQGMTDLNAIPVYTPPSMLPPGSTLATTSPTYAAAFGNAINAGATPTMAAQQAAQVAGIVPAPASSNPFANMNPMILMGGAMLLLILIAGGGRR